jgi:heat shock protein HtpX
MFKNTFRTFLLLAALSMLLVFIGDLTYGRSGMLMALAFAAVMNVVVFWFSDKIVLGVHGAQPLPEDHWLHESARRLAGKAGIPKPRLFYMDQPQPNAFATGRSPSNGVVCFTSGLLQAMGREEAEGVLAHEMSHIRNRDTLVMVTAATVAGAVMMLSRMAHWAAIFGGGRGNGERGGGHPLALLLMAILAPLAAMLIQMAISRSREFGADEGARDVMGTPMPLVNALRKLDTYTKQIPMNASPAMSHLYIASPFGDGGGLMGLFRSHPPIEKRIENLLGR